MKIASTMKSAFALALLATFALSMSALAADDAKPADKPKDVLENIHFRNLGPAVGGGRVTSVVGIPGQPNTYYAGAAAGGIFKTTDAGMTWRPIFEHESTATIGAIALAPSNPSLIWVGTGEANFRNDIVTGKGVFFSPDAGTTWKFMGLADAGQIGNVIVHPTNPDIVFVGVLGHQWGPNKDRGVFRTTDGGKTWQKVLYVDENTGVSDMAMDPSNPMILYAGMWQARRNPWMLDDGGPNSAIYRSNDGGNTWTKLTEGLPKGPIGRIGLAIARSNPSHIYAEVEAKTPGRLWESHDYGEHWSMVSNSHGINSRPFYFSHFVVSPDREDRLYFMATSLYQSDDGGHTARTIGRGNHPDHHSFWIDPTNPDRMIEGNDGGVYISQDSARTWRYTDNIPIEEFYMVATDDEKPYMLCGGLQDNNGWCGPSNSLSRGGIPPSAWWVATGGDGEYVVPAGHKSNWVYADSQNGSIRRLNAKTGEGASIRPYLQGVEDLAPQDLKYRFNWTSPIAVSASDPKEVYIGGSALMKSTDAGAHWTPISGDLTRNDKEKQKASGGMVELDLSGAETYGTILGFTLSPQDSKTIWVGTDDGNVQVTHDGGAKWANVTPKGTPEWCRINQIDVSPFSVDTAYVAVDCHEVDNNHPYVFRTSDSGKTWTAISKGLPDDPARVVREDPNRKGFLVLGTDTGLFYSYNNGDTWEAMKSNFPTVPIYDVKFQKETHDLLVATHGRGLFVMDDISPLEAFNPATDSNADMKLFPVQTAINWLQWNRGGFSQASFVAPNPPSGVVINYWLKDDVQERGGQGGPGGAAAANGGGRGGRGGAGGGGGAFGGFGGGAAGGPVRIVITDSNGAHIRTFQGPGKAGFNRAVWDTNEDGPVRLQTAALPGEDENPFRFGGGGPPAVPGSYKVTITANGKTSEAQTFSFESDPRLDIPIENFKAQNKAAREGRDMVSAMNTALNRIANLHTQLQAVQRFLGGDQQPGESVQNAAYRPVMERARTLDRKLKEFEDKVYNSDLQPDGDDSIHYLRRLHDRVQGLGRAGGGYGQPPSDLQMEEMTEVRKQLSDFLNGFNELVKTDVTDFNKLAIDKGANTLFAGSPVELKTNDVQVGGGRDEENDQQKPDPKR